MSSKMLAMVGNGRVSSLSSTCTYEWEIENFSSYNEMVTGKSVYSPSFNVNNSSWCISLYPNGSDEDSRGFISLFLSLDEDKDYEVHAKYTLSLIDHSKTVIKKLRESVDRFPHAYAGRGAKKFVDKSLLMNNANIISSNKITIVCQINVTEEETANKTGSTVSLDRMQHFEGLKNWINNPKFNDVIFKIKNKKIFAHKMMLASNSPVFAAMFDHDMQENKDNTVKIVDISYDVFNELLRFIYTGKCNLSKVSLQGVFVAADKYQVLKLRGICENKLCKTIHDKNVIELLQLADMHSAERLKKEAIEFIALHGKEFLDKAEFESLGKLNLKLLNDVLRGVFARIK